jgi:hypothetical protein
MAEESEQLPLWAFDYLTKPLSVSRIITRSPLMLGLFLSVEQIARSPFAAGAARDLGRETPGASFPTRRKAMGTRSPLRRGQPRSPRRRPPAI